MPDAPNDIENFSPYKLIDNFTKGRTTLCIVVALILHVVVIGGTSVPYIYSTWINPEATKADVADAGRGEGASTRPATASAPPRGRKGPKSRVERDVTEKAKPKDIPKGPKPKLDIPID